jgi:hypothetical protein
MTKTQAMAKLKELGDLMKEARKNEEDIDVEAFARKLKLGRNIGLNADWSVSAWSVGDFYIVDNEDGTASLIDRQWREEEEDWWHQSLATVGTRSSDDSGLPSIW